MPALKMDGTVRKPRAKKLKPLPQEIAVVFRDGYLVAVGRREVSTNAIVHTSSAYRAGFEAGKKVGHDHAAAARELDVFARTLGCTYLD